MMIRKRFVKTTASVLFVIFLIPFLYLLLSFFTSFISIGSNSVTGQFPIYITSGEIHTEFMVDLVESPFSWEEFLPKEIVLKNNLSDVKFLSIGWGSKRFFYEFLTWNDLSLELALSSTLIPNQSAMHVEYQNQFNENLKYYKIMVNQEIYMKFVNFVIGSFTLINGKVKKISDFSYSDYDSFFLGKQKYHIFNTCNMWTVEGMAILGVRRPLWSPFKFAIENSLENYIFNKSVR